jgi:2,3-bisphosphoglycerate-dependent phosphoglycerate mutase
MAIFLVRHGETPSNRDRIMQVESTPLSELGSSQAERLAPRLAARGVAQILCSDLLRARMTAAPLARLTQTELTLSPLLRERDFGQVRGLPYAQLTCDPFAPDYVPPGGESWAVFHARVAAAFALVCSARRALAGNLVVITHGLVLQALVERHLSWPSELGPRPRLFSNTGVTELSAEPPYTPSLGDCCAHLQASGRGAAGAPC